MVKKIRRIKKVRAPAKRVQSYEEYERQMGRSVAEETMRKTAKDIGETEKAGLIKTGKLIRKKEGKKKVMVRAKAVTGLLKAFGVVKGAGSGAGAGRPRGTYKYGMPIHEYKRKQAERKALYSVYKREQLIRLGKRGITPEQVQQMQITRTVEQPVEPTQSVADEELQFREWMAEKTISPNTQRILERLRRVQNKGKLDNIEQQRRHKERRIVSSAGNLFRAHENMTKVSMDVTGVSEENILNAPNTFKENPEDFILRRRPANILNTGESGNRLRF